MQTTPSISGYLGRWLFGPRPCLVKQVAGEVARQCYAGLWQRLCGRVHMASIAEVRGCARAYSAAMVEVEVDSALERHRLSEEFHPWVVESAKDQLIAMVIRDVLCEQPCHDAKTAAA